MAHWSQLSHGHVTRSRQEGKQHSDSGEGYSQDAHGQGIGGQLAGVGPLVKLEEGGPACFPGPGQLLEEGPCPVPGLSCKKVRETAVLSE